MGNQVHQRHPGQTPEQTPTTTQHSPRRPIRREAGIQPPIRRNRTIHQPRIPDRFRDLQRGQDHSRLTRCQIQPATPHSRLKCLPGSSHSIPLNIIPLGIHLAERQRNTSQTIQQPRRLLPRPLFSGLTQRIHITISRNNTHTLLSQHHASTPGRDHLMNTRRHLGDITRKSPIGTELSRPFNPTQQPSNPRIHTQPPRRHTHSDITGRHRTNTNAVAALHRYQLLSRPFAIHLANPVTTPLPKRRRHRFDLKISEVQHHDATSHRKPISLHSIRRLVSTILKHPDTRLTRRVHPAGILQIKHRHRPVIGDQHIPRMKITKHPPTLMNRFNNRDELIHDGHHLTGILHRITLLQMNILHSP